MALTNGVYLALYKADGDWVDKLVRFFTKGKYSHCEIAVKKSKVEGHYDYQEWFECYSSSPRDGGVRCKTMSKLDPLKWDLVRLDNLTENQVKAYFNKTKGKRYDFVGAVGVVLGLKQSRSKLFCSEWCYNVIFNSDDGWRFSPNDLATIFIDKR